MHAPASPRMWGSRRWRGRERACGSAQRMDPPSRLIVNTPSEAPTSTMQATESLAVAANMTLATLGSRPEGGSPTAFRGIRPNTSSERSASSQLPRRGKATCRNSFKPRALPLRPTAQPSALRAAVGGPPDRHLSGSHRQTHRSPVSIAMRSAARSMEVGASAGVSPRLATVRPRPGGRPESGAARSSWRWDWTRTPSWTS